MKGEREKYSKSELSIISRFNPTTFLCLYQTRTWISNVILFLFCVQWFWLYVLLLLLLKFTFSYWNFWNLQNAINILQGYGYVIGWDIRYKVTASVPLHEYLLFIMKFHFCNSKNLINILHSNDYVIGWNIRYKEWQRRTDRVLLYE